MHERMDRRGLLGAIALGAGAAGLAHLASTQVSAAESGRPAPGGFHFCLNTSTIRGQQLSLPAEIDIAGKAGYHAIEPWINEIDRYVKEGGSLKDLGKRIADAGLTVESAIGFPEWVVDDETQRAKGFEEAKRCMDLVAQIGGKRLAAPPAGAREVGNIKLSDAAQRYRALLELGDSMGVVPQVELWGSSRTLGRLSEVTFVAVEARHPHACMLLDVYHLYKGGSDFSGLRLLGPDAVHVMHLNDYPAEPARADITDAQRVYPGDGVAPLKEIFRTLHAIGFHGYLSLEVFNREYWRQDAFEVARTGLEKARVQVQSSLEQT